MTHYLDLDDRLICDLEMILIGAFKPLVGFMCQRDYNQVVENMHLSSGELWPIPIILPISEELKNNLTHATELILRNAYNLPIASLVIQEIWKPDIKKECLKVLGTLDKNHPYVRVIKSRGKVWYIGGPVTQINPVQHYDFMQDRLTPDQVRVHVQDNNWSNLIGFQTRNPMHRSHVELTKYALNQVPNSKLLLSPVVGITQDEDIDYHTRVRCYKILVDKYYEPNTVLLCLIPLSMRMAGPREAMWHSLIRANYSCNYFIVGRDHAGPSSKTKQGTNFYGPYDAHKLLDKYVDKLPIKIIKSHMINYVANLDKYLPDNEITEDMQVLNISGTQQRNLLKKGSKVPEWFSYPEIITELRKSIPPLHKRGFCVYLIGLSGSGKTTIAKTLESKLKEFTSRPITILDGDLVRKHLSRGLGYTREDRSANIQRIGFVASEIVKHRGIVICANIAPFEEDRKCNRELISKYGGYFEVYVNTPLDICEKRDTKGLYKMARQGILKLFTGISDSFDTPENPEIILNDYHNLESSINSILEKLKDDNYII